MSVLPLRLGSSHLLVAVERLPADPLGVEVTIAPDRAWISNGLLAVEVSLGGDRARTSLLRNLRTGADVVLEGDDFILELEQGGRIRSGDLEVVAVARETVDADRRRLNVDTVSPTLAIRMVTELRAAEWWATRWLEICPREPPQAPRDPERRSRDDERPSQGREGGGPGLRGGAGGGEAVAPAPLPRATRITRVTLPRWKCAGASGPEGPGETVSTLGYPSGCGQVVYSGDVFFALAHPGAESFARDGGLVCSIPEYRSLKEGELLRTPTFVMGAGEAGAARRAFLGYVDATRAVPSRMLFLVNDWYWKDKGRPVAALEALAKVKRDTGVLVDSFTLDDGWDFDWDEEVGIWGRLGRKRLPGGWESMVAAGRAADINVSLWFGPIGGYGYRKRRVDFASALGFEINGDKICLSGRRYREHVIESFSHWAKAGMDYIKVDGFWPDCERPDHGHPVGPAGAVAHMDSLAGIFAAWRRARPDLVVGYTSGSSPSPFWLQHADFVWRGGRDDSHAGAGEPFDRHNTYIDTCLQAHRATAMPVSAFVVFDIVQDRVVGTSDESFRRGVWWLAARTSLHHDWYVQASDLSPDRWRELGRAARWAKAHEDLFRWSRMVGGDPAKGDIYGFSAFDAGRGVLAMRNPGSSSRVLESPLGKLLDLPAEARSRELRLRGVFGETGSLPGVCEPSVAMRLEMPPLRIAVWEIESPEGGR